MKKLNIPDSPDIFFLYLLQLTGVEINYSVTESECLAVVKALNHFDSHLVGITSLPK